MDYVQGGNDYEIYEDDRVIGHRVTDPDDTIAVVKRVFKKVFPEGEEDSSGLEGGQQASEKRPSYDDSFSQ